MVPDSSRKKHTQVIILRLQNLTVGIVCCPNSRDWTFISHPWEKHVPVISGPLTMCCTQPKPRRGVGLGDQNHSASTTTMKTQQVSFFTNGIHRSNTPWYLLKCLVYYFIDQVWFFQITLVNIRRPLNPRFLDRTIQGVLQQSLFTFYFWITSAKVVLE